MVGLFELISSTSIAGVMLYVGRSFLKYHTPPLQLLLFAISQGVASTLIYTYFSNLAYIFPLVLASHLILQTLLLKERDAFQAFIVYLFPMGLMTFGELVSPLILSQLTFFAFSQDVLQSATYTLSFLPLCLMALYYLYKTKSGIKKTPLASFQTKSFYSWLIFAGSVLLLSILALNFIKDSASAYNFGTSFFLGNTCFLIPGLTYKLHVYINQSKQTKNSLYNQIEKNKHQHAALRTLREERHDFLNELALISTYVQMGKTEAALDCIAYTAASLSDRYNYSSLPNDAWITVLCFKQKEAERRKIQFDLSIDAEQPLSFNEQRLLPKLITNLVDNAFRAVEHREQPKVELIWQLNEEGQRILKISNNGPMIPVHMRRNIFQGGVTTKIKDSENNGWGLVICQRIAAELGGTLVYQSTREKTSFILTLPSVPTKTDLSAS